MTETPASVGGGSSAPNAAAADLRCRHHDDAPAVAICAWCGDLICELCRTPVASADYCARCSARMRHHTVSVSPVPWERRARGGYLRAAYETCREVLTRPRAFYAQMPPEAPVADPIFFILAVRGSAWAFVQLLFGLVYIIVGLALQESALYLNAGIQLGMTPLQFAYALLYAFMAGLLCHLVLLLFEPRHGFWASFRVYAYATAADVFYLIPIVGGFIAWPWTIYLRTVGFQETQGMSAGRALIASLTPFLLWLFIVLALIAVFVVFFVVLGMHI